MMWYDGWAYRKRCHMSLVETDKNRIFEQLPKGLIENLVKHINPRRVILFGSRVNGVVHQDSDWDFLIVVDDETRQENVNWQVMGRIRQGVRGPMDLIPIRESTFRERRHVNGSLPWIAATEGLVVYERADAA
jgi:uncharacterized protein